jgi:two-component system chemotaxis sensor kinase CheA
MMELNQYLSVFIDESREHLQAMNEDLLELESRPDDIGIVHRIFRSAHTLKGMSATMGFEDLAHLTHQMENVLDLVRSGSAEMNPSIVDCLFTSLDALESMVEDIVQGGTGKLDVNPIVQTLQSVLSGEALQQMETAAGSAVAEQTQNETARGELDDFQYSVLVQSLRSGSGVYRILVSLREDCVLKAARAYMVISGLEQHGEIIQSIPPVDEIEQEKFDRSFVLYLVSSENGANLEQLVRNVSEIGDTVLESLDEQTLKAYRAGGQPQLKTVAAQSAETTQAPAAAGQSPAREPAQSAAKRKSAAVPAAGRTIRVDIGRLDTLMNLFSELLIDRVRLEQLADEIRSNELTETVEHMARVSSDLQNMVMKLRMVPVDTVFNRFPRMVRDIAKTLGKKVELVISGADTEMDRTVVDEIGDPLVHMLRNSCDHGLELPEERAAAGKPETGTIQLRAFHSGNHVFIEVEDDGRGINREKVLATALSKGIVASEKAERMTESEIDQLLFASGFSTADKISDLSGRGVGLDVVKTKIVSLGGNVEVTSRPGIGTKFTIQLPLTLSIIAAMLIRIGGEKFAVPLASIVETASVGQEKIRQVHGNPMIDYRSGVIPLLFLGDLFEVPGYSPAEREELDVIVIQKGEKLAAVAVDEFIGQQEIVLKPIGSYLGGLFAISGATILGDGQVALIVDTNALIR